MILELNLAQELDSIYQDPLFLVLLYLQKAYDTLNHGGLHTTLKGYVSGPCMCILLAICWDHQEVFTHQNVYHDPQFK